MNSELVRTVLSVERGTALVGRARPLNYTQEHARLLRDWTLDRRSSPAWRYQPVDDLTPLRRQLDRLRNALRGQPWEGEYSERVDELLLEIQIAEAIGGEAVPELSRRRFEVAFHQQTAVELARQWVELRPMEAQTTVVSDDAGCEHSLLSRMRAWVGKERLPFRVETSGELVSLAATGEGFIVVAKGRKLAVDDVERIAVHEVLGHARPRVLARLQGEALFIVGSALGNDTQEGYAVYCEKLAGVFGERRRFELGLRHVAALSVWRGDRFVATMELLLGHGASVELALKVALRVHRGGGLAREGAYLPALCAVERAVAADPGLMNWLGAGRLSLSAIGSLRRHHFRLQSA